MSRSLFQAMAQHANHQDLTQTIENGLPAAAVVKGLREHQPKDFLNAIHLAKLNHDRVGQRVEDGIAAAASEHHGGADAISACPLIRQEPMGLRTGQENQGGALNHDGGFARLDQLDGAAFDQMEMAAQLVALEIMQAAEVARVEDACTQGELSQQVVERLRHPMRSLSREI